MPTEGADAPLLAYSVIHPPTQQLTGGLNQCAVLPEVLLLVFTRHVGHDRGWARGLLSFCLTTPKGMFSPSGPTEGAGAPLLACLVIRFPP